MMDPLTEFSQWRAAAVADGFRGALVYCLAPMEVPAFTRALRRTSVDVVGSVEGLKLMGVQIRILTVGKRSERWMGSQPRRPGKATRMKMESTFGVDATPFMEAMGKAGTAADAAREAIIGFDLASGPDRSVSFQWCPRCRVVFSLGTCACPIG